MIVHTLPLQSQISYLNNLGIRYFESARIGAFVDSERIDAKIVSDLELTDSFEFNDEIVDENNVIVMLPTDLALKIPTLFEKCYIVCTQETFMVMLPCYVVEGVSVPNPIVMTIIELRRLDEGDLEILQGIISMYEQQNATMNGAEIKKIDFQYIFDGRAEYYQKVGCKITDLKVIYSSQIN